MQNKYCLLTNDVETTSIWHNSLLDKTGIKVYKEGMPILLDLYEKYNIKSTFFFTGYIAKLIPDIVKMISEAENYRFYGICILPVYVKYLLIY